MNEVLHRVDKFVVPRPHLGAFLSLLKEIHDVIGTMAGCLNNQVLEQVDGDGKFNVVTHVTWKDAESFAAARAAIMDLHQSLGRDPVALRDAMGVQADCAVYVDRL